MPDLDAGTLGWSDGDRCKYIRLLFHMSREGGMIPDNDTRIAEAAGIKPSRAYRQQLALLRTKLRPVAQILPIVAEELGLETEWCWRIVGVSVPYRYDNQLANGPDIVVGMLSQARLFKDHLKSLNLGHKRATSGAKGGRPKKSNSFSEAKANGKLPTPTPVEEDLRLPVDLHHPDRAVVVPISPNGATKLRDTQNALNAEFDDRWWPLVPRKVGKGAARRAWRTARRKADLEILIAGIQAYASQRNGEDRSFTLHPATWLNAERWLDEEPADTGLQIDWTKVTGGDDEQD